MLLLMTDGLTDVLVGAPVPRAVADLDRRVETQAGGPLGEIRRRMFQEVDLAPGRRDDATLLGLHVGEAALPAVV
jgi:hypothetical protein